MMTINVDTITNNYEVIYVMKTVMKYYLKKIDTEFSSASSKYGSTFICWSHTWRDLVYEYSGAKSPMISGYAAIYVSIAEVNIRLIHMQTYLGSISNVFHHKVQCI